MPTLLVVIYKDQQRKPELHSQDCVATDIRIEPNGASEFKEPLDTATENDIDKELHEPGSSLVMPIS